MTFPNLMLSHLFHLHKNFIEMLVQKKLKHQHHHCKLKFQRRIHFFKQKFFICVLSFFFRNNFSDELTSSIVAYLKNFQFDGINNLLSGNTYLIPAITFIAFALVVAVLKCFLKYRSDEKKQTDKNKKAK